jgi:Bax protein
MRLFSITFIIFGLIAFAIANEQMNNCTDDGCADFYDGHTDSTPAPIVKIEPIKYTPVVDTKDEFVMSLSQCIDHIYQDVPIEKQIPKTLIIAQAALETGWGVSRFANEGNNLFGIRTFNKDDEWLLPITWDQNKWIGWGVKVYETKCDSVRDYVRIINEVWAYEELRKVRDNGGNVYEMADHLTLYASKPTYTKLIKQLIKYNIEGVYDL